MKPKRKIGRYIFGVLLLGVLVWGGLLVKNHLDFQNEMVRIVHSQEVKKLIVDDLKQEDPDAFTENGKIQSYEIDDETIEHNPMGGIMDRYPNARFKFYAHSLGGLNIQSSLGSLEDKYLDRIDGAYIYEAPNLYPQLSDAEKKQVDKIKYKIYNFIDKRDLVTWEHSEEGNEGVVGTLVRIDSKDAGGFIKQHMWGGYDYKAGYLNVKEESLDDYRLARIKQTKEQLQLKKQALESWKKSGLSGSDLISMDTIQAMGIVESLKEFALIASDYILAVCDFGIADIKGTWETLLASCRSTVSGTRCTESDIINALAQIGATKETIEMNRITELEKIKKDTLKIKESIFSLSTDMAKGIATVIGTDVALASQLQLQW